ncbi:hypothetical protein M5D96_005153 [Drosophila gunungcola]|uniref:Uncharacterized protein n=1 Tax=Drosophila gunungcola TaxID=103775 RepID=A0A9P9YVT0_9MUSC|nr:hypothetical protein M5D96_005153 [Drosophila gunungcola]
MNKYVWKKLVQKTSAAKVSWIRTLDAAPSDRLELNQLTPTDRLLLQTKQEMLGPKRGYKSMVDCWMPFLWEMALLNSSSL